MYIFCMAIILGDMIIYCIRGYFRGGFIFANFASQTSRKNFHFSLCLFTVMKTSEKSRN